MKCNVEDGNNTLCIVKEDIYVDELTIDLNHYWTMTLRKKKY